MGGWGLTVYKTSASGFHSSNGTDTITGPDGDPIGDQLAGLGQDHGHPQESYFRALLVIATSNIYPSPSHIPAQGDPMQVTPAIHALRLPFRVPVAPGIALDRFVYLVSRLWRDDHPY